MKKRFLISLFLTASLACRAGDIVLTSNPQGITWGLSGTNWVAQFGGGTALNYALLFNKSGNGQSVYTSQPFTNLFTSASVSCSLFLWVKLNKLAGYQEYSFLDMANVEPWTGGWIFQMVEGWGEDYLLLRLGTAETVKASAGFNLRDDGLWHLVGLVKSNNTYTFSIDATNDTSSTHNDTAVMGAQPLYIGNGGNYATARHMNGAIRRVLIYNRAVPSSEITNLYNGGVGTPTPPTNGMVACWPFNEGTGTNVSDSVGGYTGFFGAGAAAPSWTNWAQ